MTHSRGLIDKGFLGLRCFILIGLLLPVWNCAAQTLEVKAGRSAIVKSEPTGDAAELVRLPAGTRVRRVGGAERYHQIELSDSRIGWSYKGNFLAVASASGSGDQTATAASLVDRRDLLQIVVLDVEVGDATLIFCPEEDGVRDILLIDTGENDADRIRTELMRRGVSMTGRPITRFVITHYDWDHFGDAEEVLPWAQVVYDHGDNIKDKYKKKYQRMVSQSDVDRRRMTLGYTETFSGGVTVECVAVNQATDCHPNLAASPPNEDNPNSIALIVSIQGFDYFTGGDLTKVPEQSLAHCVKDCDVYHVNHHGSSATSSDLDFLRRLRPEVAIASNGTQHGHPTATVARRLLEEIGSKFFQTNINPDSRAHQPPAKFVADVSFHEDEETEDAEGATGSIRVVVDPEHRKYFVILPGLPLADSEYPILNP